MGRPPIPESVLLDDLSALADELGHPPTTREVDEFTDHGSMTYRRRFPTYPTALARIGHTPRDWHPLTDSEIHEYNRTAQQKQPAQTLTALFFQFLPVPKSVYTEFDTAWLKQVADDCVLSVPSEYSHESSRWEMKVPETWQNPQTGVEEDTQLPALIDWWFTSNESTPYDSYSALSNTLLRVAADADLNPNRPTVVENHENRCPRVSVKDLRHTHGIHLARNGASREWIARRMGLDRAEKAEVYFALIEHHDDF